mgnify:CR=1 FL=1
MYKGKRGIAVLKKMLAHKKSLFIGRKSLLTVLLAVLVLLSSSSVPALGDQEQALGEQEQKYENPSKQEIARKLETIARQKNIPSVILKAIAFKESSWRQFDANGNVVISMPSDPKYNPAIGIMQVASYDASNTEEVERLKYDIDYNISRGADILNQKWEFTPKIGDGDRNKLENWYFAIWAYNSWSVKNNPNNAALLGQEAYQDKVLKLAATDYTKQGLATPVPITPIDPALLPLDYLPDKNQVWSTPEPYHLGDLHVGTGSDPSRGEGQPSIVRISGQDRIETVNQIALTGWPNGSDIVILTRSDNFPDALAGVPLACKYNAPILCTEPNRLDQRVIDVLNTLKPRKVIVLGGEQAISPAVLAKLKETLTWTKDITRIAGADRYQTAALIAQNFAGQQEAVIATGLDYPDALSLASAAAARGIPLVLSTAKGLPEATKKVLQELKPSRIYVAGGEAAVAPQVVEQLKTVLNLNSGNITRLAGSDRYETSVKIAQAFYPAAYELYLATGRDFLEPLAAGAWAASRNACLLLVSPQGFTINGPTENYLTQLPSSVQVRIIGGEATISEKTVDRIKNLLGKTS